VIDVGGEKRKKVQRDWNKFIAPKAILRANIFISQQRYYVKNLLEKRSKIFK
jgi:hypothetical protein